MFLSKLRLTKQFSLTTKIAKWNAYIKALNTCYGGTPLITEGKRVEMVNDFDEIISDFERLGRNIEIVKRALTEIPAKK